MLRHLLLILTCGLVLVAGAAANERLMVSDLKENETMVIDYLSVTGDRSLGRQYLIRGGDSKLLVSHRSVIEWRNRVPHIVSKALLGDLVLTRDDVLGLDALLVFYAANFSGNCGTRDTVVVEYLRDGKRVGHFTYRDDTCFLKFKDEPEVRTKTRGKISDALMDVLLTFPALDERVKAENP